jgi:hypothetical protein
MGQAFSHKTEKIITWELCQCETGNYCYGYENIYSKCNPDTFSVYISITILWSVKEKPEK